ncbi:MAG TPA: hypothetical protein VGL91_10545, partial [Acidobacteriota bacterium]
SELIPRYGLGQFRFGKWTASRWHDIVCSHRAAAGRARRARIGFGNPVVLKRASYSRLWVVRIT